MNEAPFDRDSLMDLIASDMDLLREIAGIFEEDGPRYVGELRAAISAGDAGAVSRSAHSLKGACGVFRAGPASAAALRLELMGREGRLDGAEEALADLDRAVEDLRLALRETIAGAEP